MAIMAGRFYKTVKPRKMITIGLVGATTMTFLFMTLDLDANLWLIRLILFFRGFTMAFAVIAVQATTFSNISMQETGRASSIFNTNRQVASSFGTAALGTMLFELLLTKSGSALDQLLAYHIAFLVAAVPGLIGIVFALTVHDEDAAESLKK